PQSMAAAFEDVQIPVSVETGGARIDQRRVFGVGAVLWNAALAVAGGKRYPLRLHVNDANAAIVQIGDSHALAWRIQSDAVDAAELRFQRGAVIAGVRFFAADAGKGADHAGGWIEDANPMVQSVGKID